jgi:hypothetical protein
MSPPRPAMGTIFGPVLTTPERPSACAGRANDSVSRSYREARPPALVAQCRWRERHAIGRVARSRRFEALAGEVKLGWRP